MIHEGDQPTLTVMLPGDHVGELGVIDGTARSASVASLRPTTVVEVSGVAFRAALDADVAIYRALVTQLSQRLRSTSNRLSDLTILDLGARLAKFLLSEMGGARVLELHFSQSELGQLLGGARQSINQLLATMERDGLITVMAAPSKWSTPWGFDVERIRRDTRPRRPSGPRGDMSTD